MPPFLLPLLPPPVGLLAVVGLSVLGGPWPGSKINTGLRRKHITSWGAPLPGWFPHMLGWFQVLGLRRLCSLWSTGRPSGLGQEPGLGVLKVNTL